MSSSRRGGQGYAACVSILDIQQGGREEVRAASLLHHDASNRDALGCGPRMKLNCAFDWIAEIGRGGANRSRMCLGRMASAADFPRGLSAKRSLVDWIGALTNPSTRLAAWPNG
jgi:hypothetical protein